MVSFLTYNKLFRLERIYGVGLYPFRARSPVARLVNRYFPGLGHTIVMELYNNKASAAGPNWLDFLHDTAMQTDFTTTRRLDG